MAKLTQAERFRDAREIYNKHGQQSITEVAKNTCIPKSLISSLEKDLETDANNKTQARNVGYLTVTQLAEYYGVSLEWLCMRSDDPRIKSSAVDDLGLSAESINQLETWKKDKPRYLSILSDFLTSKSFCNFLEHVQYYRLLADSTNGGNLSDLENDLSVINDYKKTMLDVLTYIKNNGDFSPYLMAYFSLHQCLLPGDIANFYLSQAQQSITEAIKNEMTEYVLKK